MSSNHRFRMQGLIALAFLAVLVGGWSIAGNRNAYPLPEDRGAAGILGALERLPVFARVLYITAHPDDEGGGTLTWLARKFHARTALLALTRGDGGQNVLGDEKYEALGLVRTGELLEACKIYGVETYFSTVFEFGFSKSAEETLSKWGHDATQEEVVRFIRTWRPSIIISAFRGDSRDGHGHHQTAGIMAHKAFRVAGDPAKFPEHLSKGLRPWQAKKLYRRGGRGGQDTGAAPTPSDAPAASDWNVSVNTGGYDPVLGRTYREIGAEGYSKHRSQGSASSYALGGRADEFFKLMDSTVGIKPREEGFFDSIDTSLKAIADLAGSEESRVPNLRKTLEKLQSFAAEAIRSFQPRNPEASAPAAIAGYELISRSIREVEASNLSAETKALLEDALQEKQRDFQEAANAALGIYVVSRTDDMTAIPGQKIPVTVTFLNRGREEVDVKKVTLWTPEEWVSALPVNAPLGKIAGGGQSVFRFTVDVSAEAKLTQPFWYRAGKQDSRYKTRSTKNIFAPFDSPEIEAQVTYRSREVDIPITAATTAQVNDPLRGVDFHDLQIVPALSVRTAPDLLIFPLSGLEQKRELQVSIFSNQKNSAQGSVSIRVPERWKVEPASADFNLTRKGEIYNARFALSIPGGTKEGNYSIEAIARQGAQEFRQGYVVVSYPENWTRHLYSPSRADVKVFDVKVSPNLTVGYVSGAGDEVPQAIEQLGVKVETLTASDLAHRDLALLDVIVTGIRAYNVNEDLRDNNQRLLKYVENGGHLIVQYNQPIGGRGGSFPYGPYPMTVSAQDRITVEESPVRILDTASPVFGVPNKITAADFEGWVQERGLYFMSQWDARYSSLLSGNDPGEPPKDGGMLITRVGKGYYIFTAYAWFRQLPAGVPGAFRIFANLLSLK